MTPVHGQNDSSSKVVYLVASGDLRASANRNCWPAQQEMEKLLGRAIASAGYQVVRAHGEIEGAGHGFIASQRQGIEVFRNIPSHMPLIVAEAVWQYSHHVLAGLTTHRGPILTVANWSGQWPGLVGMLNLNGSLTKAGIEYSTLWSEQFDDDYFTRRLHGTLAMDIGRGSAIELPRAETERRWQSTTPEWPIMHAILHGVSRDQFMAQHKANHIQVVYSSDSDAADFTMEVKAAMADALGIRVKICGMKAANKDRVKSSAGTRSVVVSHPSSHSGSKVR